MENESLSPSDFTVVACTEAHLHFAEAIVDEMAESAKARGTGIARRSPEYIQLKMQEGKAVIALTKSGQWAGFCYIEAWGHDKFVANSGLIIVPAYRKYGLAGRIKEQVFKLSRQRYPDAKIFGLTTSLAVMKINSRLGYEPVVYEELTDDEAFWKGCQSCVNFDVLIAKGRKNCLCTAMLYDPADHPEPAAQPVVSSTGAPPKKKKRRRMREFKGNIKVYGRWMRLKQHVFLAEQAKRKAAKTEKAQKERAEKAELKRDHKKKP